MNRPRASIVIPAHNHAAVTRRCLDAVFATTSGGDDVEVIVVDDASTDETASILAAENRITVVSLSDNAGFALACNAGARAASGDYLVFLNNDTEPQPGWLDALVRYGDARPRVAVVGSKLLFPDGTLQHAGVVICHDLHPRHLYAGFPGDHPAANRSRRFAAVTFASALVRRGAFADARGFDPVFVNGLEDVDLCLRLQDAGWEIHYCHESVITHLETATRGRRSEEALRNHRAFRERWGGRVTPDDIGYYVADGLLDIGYADLYPLRLSASPELAILAQDGDDTELGRLLRQRADQVGGLLQEVARLTVALADRSREEGATRAPKEEAGDADRGNGRSSVDLLERDREVERHIHALQTALAERASAAAMAAPAPSDYLAYDGIVRGVHDAVDRVVPPGAGVAVVSRGDPDLVRLPGRRGVHLQQTPRGTYAGHHPANAAEAVAYVEDARRAGAEFLVVPSPSFWWLEHYDEFADVLNRRHECVHRDDACAIYRLAPVPTAGAGVRA